MREERYFPESTWLSASTIKKKMRARGAIRCSHSGPLQKVLVETTAELKRNDLREAGSVGLRRKVI